MKNKIFEVWVESYDGVCVVLERGPNNELSFQKEEDAINWAKKRHENYPNINFKVISEECGAASSSKVRKFVFSTKNLDK